MNEQMWGASTALGFGVGFLSVIALLFLLSAKNRPVRPKTKECFHFSPNHPSETADWLNLLLARLNASHVDLFLAEKACEIVTQKIKSAPDLPPALTKASIKPLRRAESAPFISNILLSTSESDDSSSITFIVHYQGSPSLAVSATASGGIANLADLFSFTIDVEFVLRLLVARLTISISESKGVSLSLGNEIIIDVEVRPILGEAPLAQNKQIESISNWLSSFALRELRGKTFVLFS